MKAVNTVREKLQRIPRTRYGKQTFLLSLDGKKAKVLDVGCGNNSPMRTKMLCRDCYYVGVDVGDYNQSMDSIEFADEYHVFSPDGFAEGIDALTSDYDAVISAHNIEHCNKPEETVRAMCRRLKKGGRIHMSFPNSDSVNFPSRKGTLNFYDDPTHIYVPDMDATIRILEDEGMMIVKAIKGYKPLYYRFMGGVTEHQSKKRKQIMRGTWAYWGFESIIIAEKLKSKTVQY